MDDIALRGSEILEAIDGQVETVLREHLAKQKLWMPSDLVSEDYQTQSLPPDVVAMLVLNLLTEDGLPYFLSLLVHHLGPRKAIWEWSRVWTAEEDRHGAVIKNYLQLNLSKQQMVGVERLQYQYLSQGFWPDWGGDPIKLLAYVVLQEQATRVSHQGIGRLSESYDPVLNSILRKIAAEEAKHHLAYLKFFQAALVCDPSHALSALLSVIRTFEMPGRNTPHFGELSEIQLRKRVFGAIEFHEIVVMVIDKLNIVNLTDIDAAGEKCRDGILKAAQVLGKLSKRSLKYESRTIKLSFLGDDFVVEV